MTRKVPAPPNVKLVSSRSVYRGPAFSVVSDRVREPGGIVVVRFAKDRSERKLVADLAPIVKR